MTILSEPIYDIDTVAGNGYEIDGEFKNTAAGLKTVYVYKKSNGVKTNCRTLIDGFNYKAFNDVSPLLDYFVVGLDPTNTAAGAIAPLPIVAIMRDPVYVY